MSQSSITTFPYPLSELDGVVRYLAKLYDALGKSEANRSYDLSKFEIRITATEPPDPHPGLMWVDIS